MSPDKLVYMANQIGKFFAHKSDEEAIAGIAEHLKSFWEKRMLAEIYGYLDAGGKGLDDRPSRALQQLRQAAE
ncbi:NAD-dependent formate dehydrogenase [Acidocella aquatica]|uniref:NAD-dependent formate dehydrogenase n=1 Tax=Acidocella aquatica TaxID=1922313 RepID=A0ABQ6A693_9PROT|nr:formate dehydrogenase subunit delta [Acidocella aquatica]GLR67956.1 NAD-dependent formate dehydrogenase [Acidocella aquatica]